MKKINIKYMSAVPFIVAALFLSGCGEKKFGSGIDNEAEVKTVAEILNVEELEGSKVTVKGKIHVQCPSRGCWFILKDETGQIYVDLSRNGFELPSLQGRSVAVSGIVSDFKGTMKMINAEGVELR